MGSRAPLRIANVSGATGDAPDMMYRMATEGQVDAIVGDWLSEMNIAWNAIEMSRNPDMGFEMGFLDQLTDTIDVIAEKGIKVVSNAGALNTAGLTKRVEELCRSRGLGEKVTVAAVYGDNITHLLREESGHDIRHLDHPEQRLADWDLEPAVGTAYIGCRGIIAALHAGADIVICGRVTDASPVMGLAAWWWNWGEESYDELGRALVAGHLIECGPYVTGANFSGFKEHLDEMVDLGHPIAEVSQSGECVITKHATMNGFVSKYNVTAQLLYELQGHLYLNPDVVADLSNVEISQVGKNRVAVTGIKGFPPPDTAKAMISGIRGYQAEASFYINGLDIDEKVKMMRNQLQHMFRKNQFSKLSIDLYGCKNPDPKSQKAGTLQLRIFAQARKEEDISFEKFRRPIYALRMQSFPGYHMNLDFRTMAPKAFMSLFPALVPVEAINMFVMLQSGEKISIPPPVKTRSYSRARPSTECSTSPPMQTFGPTQRAPLGSIVHARSGDKGDNSNVGFFVVRDDEYLWLQSFLTVSRLKELFAEDWTRDYPVERCEFPNIHAVHFRVLDFLDGGIASSSRLDGLGKGVGEYLRSRIVDVPEQFLSRGRI